MSPWIIKGTLRGGKDKLWPPMQNVAGVENIRLQISMPHYFFQMSFNMYGMSHEYAFSAAIFQRGGS